MYARVTRPRTSTPVATRAVTAAATVATSRPAGRPFALASACVFGLLLALPDVSHAQILKRVKQAAKRAIEEESKPKPQRPPDKPAAAPAAARASAQDTAAARAPSTGSPGQGAWANYDFVPGDSVLFLDDFLGDNVGDFPRHLELVDGNFEIVEWQGQRLLRATSNGGFAIPLPRTLPERFTIEFEAQVEHGNSWIRVTTAPYWFGPRRGAFKGSAVNVARSRAGLFPVGALGPSVAVPTAAKMAGGLVPVRIMADGNYMKMYLGEQRVVNAPNAVFARSDTLYIGVTWAFADAPILLGPIRVAGGGRDLYDRLAKDGRVATQGILFATASDRLRPESTPTLKEMAAMMRDHPALRLRIEGHTDDVGDDAANLLLSEQRAASVRRWLIEEASVDGSRLEATGLGETKPASSNSTSAGRAQNRRVELVRVGG